MAPSAGVRMTTRGAEVSSTKRLDAAPVVPSAFFAETVMMLSPSCSVIGVLNEPAGMENVTSPMVRVTAWLTLPDSVISGLSWAPKTWLSLGEVMLISGGGARQKLFLHTPLWQSAPCAQCAPVAQRFACSQPLAE